ESANFVQASHSVECVQVTSITGGELGAFEITRAQISISKRIRALSLEEMEPQPATVAARHALGFTKEGNEQKQHEIGIDLGLELEVSRKIFRGNFAGAVLELQRGVKRVIDLFNKGNQRTDIVIAHAGARIVLFELFDQPARIVNADVEAIVSRAQKCPGELAQFERRPASQDRQLPATAAIDQAIFQIDADLRVGALEKFLDLAEERLVHKTSDGRASSSR